MKNGALVTAWLNWEAEQRAISRTRTVEAQRDALDWLESGRSLDLYNACTADGWTQAELDAAYERRFALRVVRGSAPSPNRSPETH